MKKRLPIKLSLFLFFWGFVLVFGQTTNPYPYSTNTSSLTVWNGETYVPFFIKGTNLGAGIPGTFPGELAPTYTQYIHWFEEIKNAGFNTFRIYTLHYPRFYEALYDYNNQHPDNPLLMIQGIWLDEEIEGYQQDLYQLTNTFQKEIQDDIKCVHGSNTIPERYGKASGVYTKDVSKWCLAYIIGREVYPEEIANANKNHPENTAYTGTHLAISNATPSEYWISSMLDYSIKFEHLTFNTQRPVSFSSWPTLDPLTHPEETTEEDSEQVDLSKIQILNAPAGMFISYHAYPYYPDFIGKQDSYQNFYDNYGPNSYKGYLTELKSHYPNQPLIIAEYGVPSSWVIAHYTSSGMNHGGFDEYNQGLTNLRILQTISDTQCGGGMQFSLFDEWFKRTWIADVMDYNPDSRILWQNLFSAEQNFGLLSYEKPSDFVSLKKNTADAVTQISANVNTKFLEIKLDLKKSFANQDELWVALDTYDNNLGDSKLPNGVTIPNRSEFALKITNHSAELYVTQAYDTYGIWHKVSPPEQLYHSTATDGAPWNIVRVKNNSGNTDVQYIGNLEVNYDFQPYSSKDGVTIADKSMHIRLPWNYINFTAPNTKTVFNDDRSTPAVEDIVSDGVKINVYYGQNWFGHDNRFTWNGWTSQDLVNIPEKRKISYYVMQDNLYKFNTKAISYKDEYTFEDGYFPVTISETDGLLLNDYDLDGTEKTTVIIDNPTHGYINLQPDGSFEYSPKKDFVGIDSFKYSIYDGYSLSIPSTVTLNVKNNILNVGSNNVSNGAQNFIKTYPNPVSDLVTIESEIVFDELILFDAIGKKLITKNKCTKNMLFDVSYLSSGIYYVVGIKEGRSFGTKISKK